MSSDRYIYRWNVEWYTVSLKDKAVVEKKLPPLMQRLGSKKLLALLRRGLDKWGRLRLSDIDNERYARMVDQIDYALYYAKTQGWIWRRKV